MIVALLAAVLLTGEPPFAETTMHLRVPGTRLALRDLDGDGRKDLLQLNAAGIRNHPLDADGLFAADAAGTITWPSDTVCWDLADIDADGLDEIVLLVDGASVRVYEPGADGAFDAGREVLADVPGFVPRGVRHMNVVHDVDADGRPDLVVPGTGFYLLHFGEGQGRWSAPLRVAFEARIDIEVGDPDSLDERFGQDVMIPWFTLEDVDGDGRTDLVAESDDELSIYLADPALPEEPSWTLDLAGLRVEGDRPDRVDLDDLFSAVQPDVAWKVADLDGEPPWDMVLQQGARFRVFAAGSHGPNLGQPDQVLKASGNVLYFLLRDVDGDGRPDLQIVRAEKVSLGRVLRWLIVSGSLDFDVFTYANEGGVFSRKPSSRRTLTLRIPALLGFVSQLQEMEEDYEERRKVPAKTLAFDGDGVFNDVVDVRGGSVVLFRDAGPDEPPRDLLEHAESMGSLDAIVERFVLRDLDALAEGGARTIDLGDIDRLLTSPGFDLREGTRGREPDLTWPLGFEPWEGGGSEPRIQLRVDDLDGDGRSDVVLVGRDESHTRVVQLLVSR